MDISKHCMGKCIHRNTIMGLDRLMDDEYPLDMTTHDDHIEDEL